MSAEPIPPLKVPKLRPKFEVYHYRGPQAKSPTLARGIASIEDAVRIAWALAASRLGPGHVGIIARVKNPNGGGRESKGVGCASCDSRRTEDAVRTELENAQRAILAWAEGFARGEQRAQWFKRYDGGFGSGSARVSLFLSDDAFRVALGKNDFTAAAARAAELEEQVAQ